MTINTVTSNEQLATTLSLSLQESIPIQLDDKIEKFNSQEEFNPKLEINMPTTQTVDFFRKLYPFPLAFSNFLYSIDQYSQEKNNFSVQGLMVSQQGQLQDTGLRMAKGALGLHIALTAGTGIVPFMDLVFYILRRIPHFLDK